MEDNRPYKIPKPKGLTEYILKHCQRQGYLIFSEKEDKVVCTRCGAEFPLRKMGWIRHVPHRNRRGGYYPTCPQEICPACREPALPKNIQYGRKTLRDYGRIVWMRAYGKVTFLEVDRFMIDYENPHPEVCYDATQQIRLTAEKQERWDRDDGWFGTFKWYRVKKIGLKAPPQTYGYSDWHDHFYEVEIGTDLRYADVDPGRFDRGYWDENMEIAGMIRYMSDFLRYPAIEILEKSGFENIVISRVLGQRSRYINLRAKDLRKILKVDGADVKKLREKNPAVKFVTDLHQIRKMAPWAEIKDVEELKTITNVYIDEQEMAMIEERADVSKLLKRILEETRATGDMFTLSDYADYLEAVTRLGRRLDKKTLYPGNFLRAHNEAIDEAEEKKMTIDAANFAKYQKEITRMEEPMIRGDLMLRPARTPQELRNESQALNHCVRTYIDRVARGQTSILFIRRAEAPEKPYFTMELNSKGEMVQCRGKNNCGYPAEVGKLIEEFMNDYEKGKVTA